MGVSKPVRLGDRLRRGRRGRAAVRPAGSNLDDLVIITGFSGAGKSTAMAVFEDPAASNDLYPAVPERSARLRFFVSCDHTEAQIVSSVQALAEELGHL